MAELLLKAGADPMIVDQDGVTCLHLAAMSANAVLLKLLFETPAKKPDANKADKTGSTPLHHAVEPDDEGDAKAAAECVAILLSHGANAAAKNGDGQTAAELATLTAVQAALEADGGGGRRGGRAAAGRDGSNRRARVVDAAAPAASEASKPRRRRPDSSGDLKGGFSDPFNAPANETSDAAARRRAAALEVAARALRGALVWPARI